MPSKPQVQPLPTVTEAPVTIELTNFQEDAVPESDYSTEHTIEELVRIGLSHNPLIEEARNRLEAARFRAPQEGSLPDPMLNTTTDLSPVETAAGRQTFAMGISQKFVDSQRRSTKAAIAMEDVRAANEELRLAELELAEQIRNACFQLLFIRQAIAITREDIASLSQIEDVVIQAHEVDQSVTQQDVLNVHIQQSDVENRLTELIRQERTFEARLVRLLHMSSGTNIEILDDLAKTSSVLDLEQMTGKALAARPELAAQIAKMRRDRQKICLANLQHKPDFTVGLNWIGTSSNGISPVANGDDALLLGVGFNLPVYRERIRAAVCEARANSRASENRFAVIQDQIAEEVFGLIAKAESLSETLALLEEDIIPKAERTLELSREEYSQGNLEYIQLIDNWRSLLRYRINASRLTSDYNQAMSSLARACGDMEVITEGIIEPAEER